MAKDKKTTKASSKFAKPSEAPAGGGGWSLTDGDGDARSGENDGKLFIITPLREEEHADTFSKAAGATKPHIVADVVELNEKKPEKSVEHEDVWIFSGWVLGAIRSSIGGAMVLGRLVKAKDKSSATGYVWKLEDGDEDDVAVAEAYLDSLSPFKKKEATKGSKKSKPEPEPEKKAGKKKSKK